MISLQHSVIYKQIESSSWNFWPCVIICLTVSEIYADMWFIIQGQTDLHMENATSAYLTARQEISILQTIDHQNIVPLLGLSLRPLALVLSLAPLGSLGNKLLQIGNDGRRLSVYAIKQIVLQVNSFVFFLPLIQGP